MKQKKMNYLPVIILPIILFMCFSLWLVDIDPLPTTSIPSETGVFDMRKIDFSKSLGGISKYVEYVPGVLLTPEEFAGRDDILVGKVPDGTRVCTMRIKVLMPENMYYGIVGYSMNYASSVYINGKWLFNEGKPATTMEDEKSYESYRLFSAVPEDGVIEILVQTSAFSNIDNSSGMAWTFGEYDAIRTFYTRYTTTHIVVMAWYFIAAIVSLLLFFALPKYKANGWLALLGLLWSIRSGLKGVKILLTLFPIFDWPVIYKLEILTSPLTIILFVLILHSTFPKALPKWLRWSLMGAAGAFVIAIFVLPWYRFFGHSSYTNMIVYLALAIMLPFILFSMRENKFTLPQFIVLGGVAMSIFAFAWDADYFSHGWAPIAISQPMMLTFILFMTASAILATMEKTVEREVLLAQKVEEQKSELTQAHISVMLSQIQPHFLYNSLTSIAMLCTKNPDEAKKAVIDFSTFLRGNLDSLKEEKMISFEKELRHLEAYLNIEKMRFGDELHVVCDIAVKDFSVPPITVQPIVENAAKYGVGKKEDGGTITIATRENEIDYMITVADDGIGFDTEKCLDTGKSHTGIQSVRQRLKSQCGGTLDIVSQIGVGTTATIKIPKKI